MQPVAFVLSALLITIAFEEARCVPQADSQSSVAPLMKMVLFHCDCWKVNGIEDRVYCSIKATENQSQSNWNANYLEIDVYVSKKDFYKRNSEETPLRTEEEEPTYPEPWKDGIHDFIEFLENIHHDNDEKLLLINYEVGNMDNMLLKNLFSSNWSLGSLEDFVYGFAEWKHIIGRVVDRMQNLELKLKLGKKTEMPQIPAADDLLKQNNVLFDHGITSRDFKIDEIRTIEEVTNEKESRKLGSKSVASRVKTGLNLPNRERQRKLVLFYLARVVDKDGGNRGILKIGLKEVCSEEYRTVYIQPCSNLESQSREESVVDSKFKKLIETVSAITTEPDLDISLVKTGIKAGMSDEEGGLLKILRELNAGANPEGIILVNLNLKLHTLHSQINTLAEMAGKMDDLTKVVYGYSDIKRAMETLFETGGIRNIDGYINVETKRFGVPVLKQQTAALEVQEYLMNRYGITHSNIKIKRTSSVLIRIRSLWRALFNRQSTAETSLRQ